MRALQGDQGADVAPGQGLRRGTDFFGRHRGLDPAPGQGLFPHPAQHPPDIGLEQNDDNEDEALDDNVQEPFQGEEFQLAGHQVGQKQQKEPGQNLDGLGAPEGQDHLVDDDGHQDDVRQVLPAQVEEKVHDKFRVSSF